MLGTIGALAEAPFRRAEARFLAENYASFFSFIAMRDDAQPPRRGAASWPISAAGARSAAVEARASISIELFGYSLESGAVGRPGISADI